jgi:hypothetical protein
VPNIKILIFLYLFAKVPNVYLAQPFLKVEDLAPPFPKVEKVE